jgi:uncharacterized coiled-coil protein SlyX
MADLDQDPDDAARAARVRTIYRWIVGAAVVGAGWVAAKFIFQAITGLLGLGVLAGMIGLAVYLTPVVADMLANWRLKLITDEAGRNPIETMKNLLIDKTRSLQDADQRIVDFETEIGNFESQLDDFKKAYPDKAAAYEELDAKMHEALNEMKDQQRQARQALKDFTMKIKEAESIYQMALAAQRVTALSKSAEEQVFAKIREEVAFNAVRSSLNRAFAQLNLALDKRNDVQASSLPAPTLNTLPGRTPGKAGARDA